VVNDLGFLIYKSSWYYFVNHKHKRAIQLETSMEKEIAEVIIPDNLSFFDLRLSREPDGCVSFEWAVIERICEASNISVDLFRHASEDNVSGLIVGWYQAHLDHGGEQDPVAEDLISEVEEEIKAGQDFSLEPGHA
jgi:hypothetical protein